MDQIEFKYVKSNSYRVIHCDGVIGNITPRGVLHMTLFSERQELPSTGIRRIDWKTNTLDPEELQESEGCFERELEVDVMMGVQTAKELHDWLGEVLAQS